MIIEFDDSCWSLEDDDWKRSLIELLVPLVRQEQHALQAHPVAMLTWCTNHLPLYVDYFKTRLASAQLRAKAQVLRILPGGGANVISDPPWSLTASAARNIATNPLRVVFENDRSDQAFATATISAFSKWCREGWIAPDLGGGTEMRRDIRGTGADPAARWRTFYMFDSDRLHPSELNNGWKPPRGDGCEGYQFEVACAAMPPERWHRLNRRSIENYLPATILSAVDASATTVLLGSSVGPMAHFFNFKQGLAGDGVLPPNAKKAVRAARSQGFWSTLQATESAALQKGFGDDISNHFNNVPSGHAWPADVVAEMDALAVALQDAM